MIINTIFSFLSENLVYPLILPGLILGTLLIIVGMLVPNFLKYKLPIIITGSALIVIFVFFGGKYTESLSWKQKEAKMNMEIAVLNSKQSDITTNTIIKYVDRVKVVEKLRTEYENVYVDKIITPEIDTAYGPLPNSFVRLHNAAAAGTVPGAPSNTDGATSGVKLTTATKTVVDNYQICRLNSEQLIGIQEWVLKQKKLNPSK